MRAKWTVVIAMALLAALGVWADTAESHASKTFAPKPGGTLEVKASFQDVTVEIGAGKSVEVTVDMKVTLLGGDAKETLKSCEPVFEESAGSITIRAKSASLFTFGFSSCKGLISVKMPPGMNLKLGAGSGDIAITGAMPDNDAAIETGSGDVRLTGALRDLKAQTGSGNVTARWNSPARKVTVHTGSGDVNLKGGAQEFAGETGSGDISAEDLRGSADVHTGSGEVTARWASLATGSTLKGETGSGNVRLTLPKEATLGGTLDVGSGTIRCDFQGKLSQRDRHYEIAGGQASAQVRIETGSGDIAFLKE